MNECRMPRQEHRDDLDIENLTGISKEGKR